MEDDGSVDDLLARQQEFYELRAPDHGDVSKPDRKSYGELDSTTVPEVVDQLRPAGDVLELACGSGAFTGALVRHARTLTCLDGSPRMLELNRANVADPRVEYICADMPPTHFDLPRRRVPRSPERRGTSRRPVASAVVAAPGGAGPIGPFPPGVETDEQKVEYDKLRRRVLWSFPSGLYILGSRAGERRNGMTLNWATQVSFDPKLVAVGVEKPAFTHELLTEGRVFSVCTVDREDRAIVRKFTKPVEVDLEARTLNGFPFHDGRTGAPILDAAPAWVDCEVRTEVDCGGHTLFLGEVVDAGFAKPEDTPVLRMEDTRMSYGG